MPQRPDPAHAHAQLMRLKENLARVIRGKAESLELLLTALAAGGSVLLEDVPGVGKTTLAKAPARSIRAEFRRVQFTPDLLPADILGSSIYNPVQGSFEFRRGPIFSHILLADEINPVLHPGPSQLCSRPCRRVRRPSRATATPCRFPS